MMDIPKLELEYARRIDWKKTLEKLNPGDTAHTDLTDSQYTLFCMARKELRESKGMEIVARKISQNMYVISRIQ